MMKNKNCFSGVPIMTIVRLAAFSLFLMSPLFPGLAGKVAAQCPDPPCEKPKPATVPIPSSPQPLKSPTSRTPSARKNPSARKAFHPRNPRIELVYVRPGTFLMGFGNGSDNNEAPAHQVTINYSFYMGKYEVTQAEWQAVMGSNPSRFTDCGGNCPVESVSWDDTQQFIQRLNQMNDGYIYRLPTEAEWEYACRAGTTGDDAGNVEGSGWFSENAGNRTHAVGQKQSNAWGLADMLGNVWEWSEDWYHQTYTGAPSNGSAWLNGGEQTRRVLRGGSYFGNGALCSSRIGYTPEVYRDFFGFRVVAIARVQ